MTMTKEIIDRLEYAHGTRTNAVGQEFHLFHDPVTDKEYWIPAVTHYRFDCAEEVTKK